MIKHILTIIWNERKVNFWIVLEYTLVFCILWFCFDYLYYMVRRSLEPRGFNVEHTYQINIGEKKGLENSMSTEEKIERNTAYAMTFYERIKQYPDIEAVSLSRGAAPNRGGSNFIELTVNDNQQIRRYRQQYITEDFLQVFKINLLQGKIHDWKDGASKNLVLISADENDYYGPFPVSQVHTLKRPNNERELTVTGTLEKIKNNFFYPYEYNVFYLLQREDLQNLTGTEFCVRVKPGADKDFTERFSRDMKEQLNIGPYYLQSIESLEERGKLIMEYSGITNELNSIYAITSFLLVNIFLGVVGTFWYRTQSRQGEMGLRIALGATRRNVRIMMCGETLILLVISGLLGLNIAVNLENINLLESLGIPTTQNWIGINSLLVTFLARSTEEGANAWLGIQRYFVVFFITFIFLAVISLLAVWYPAKQASGVQPAEALRDE